MTGEASGRMPVNTPPLSFPSASSRYTTNTSVSLSVWVCFTKMTVSLSQLATYGSDNSSSFSPGFPVIRWAQTADYGFVPNPRLRAVFMAVAMDLGDPSSPFGSIHPRDKQDVGLRLALAGRAIAYGDSEVYFTGPLATTATMRYTSPSKHSQSYCNLSQKSFQILSSPLPSLLLSQVLTCRRWW